MAVTTGVFWISLILSVSGSYAAGELRILHHPDSLIFMGTYPVVESSLTDIFSAALGFSVQESTQWTGMLITDPFNTPEAVVEVYVDGVKRLSDAAHLNKNYFKIDVDQYEPDTFENLQHRIKQRYTNGGNIFVNIKLSDPNEHPSDNSVIGEIEIPEVPNQPLKYLKPNIAEDNMFLSELEIMKTITNKIKSEIISADNVPDFYNFRFVSLHPLIDFYGPTSPKVTEAEKLLGKALNELKDAFKKVYDGSVLFTVVTTDVAHTRRTARSIPRYVREVAEESENNEEKEVAEDKILQHDEVNSDANREAGYSADYAAIFNIILWFGVIFTFTLIAIVYALIDMDPGRDSIIYRMTSTRMKKDN